MAQTIQDLFNYQKYTKNVSHEGDRTGAISQAINPKNG